METVVQAGPQAATEQHPSQVFVDASGRRARRMTRCGYLLGLGCVGYIGMVAMGLSGTRVAALPGVPTSAENQIIAGLSDEGGSVGLHLTRSPVVPRPAAGPGAAAHAAAVRSAAARAAALASHPTAARTRPAVTTTGQAVLRPMQQTAASTQPHSDVQVLAEGASYPDPADPSETKSVEKAEKADEKAAAKAQEKAAKADAKSSRHSSASASPDSSY